MALTYMYMYVYIHFSVCVCVCVCVCVLIYIWLTVAPLGPGDCDSVVEYLLSMHKVLALSPPLQKDKYLL
jgi:hypothetical protein